ncbi:MAG: YIP1 family protein [Chloracidobacterium sp.]|nr:YIP1 family protein [Chloracidobacterium sp.]
MNRIAGIIAAAVGFVICILSITKIVPGMTSTGVTLILFGGLVIGLSFVDKPEDEGVEKMSTGSTLANIFFAPADVFKNLRRHPRWLIAALIMSILSVTYTNLFLQRLGPDRVANFAIDKTLEMSMIRDNEQAKKGIEEGRAQALADNKDPVIKAGQAVSGFAASIFGYAFLALIFLLFSMAMGGQINFWQAFAAGIYATFPVSVIRFVLNTVLLFIKDPDDIHPILGQQTLIQDNPNFLVLPAEHPIIFTLLGSFSLLLFYWIWMIATGLKNTGEKVTGTIAWSAALSIYVLLIIFGVAMAALFPSFIS